MGLKSNNAQDIIPLLPNKSKEKSIGKNKHDNTQKEKNNFGYLWICSCHGFPFSALQTLRVSGAFVCRLPEADQHPGGLDYGDEQVMICFMYIYIYTYMFDYIYTYIHVHV